MRFSDALIYCYAYKIQYVSIGRLFPFLEYNRESDLETPGYKNLLEDIKANGIKEPLIIGYSLGNGKAVLVEGNHRLLIAKKLGMNSVPVTVSVYQKSFDRGIPVALGISIKDGYVPSDLYPSDIGLK